MNYFQVYCDLDTRKEVYSYCYSECDGIDTINFANDISEELKRAIRNSKKRYLESHTYNVFDHKGVRHFRLYSTVIPEKYTPPFR